MPFYQVWATVHHEATCVIEANDQDHAVAIATALSGIDYDNLGYTNGAETSVDEIVPTEEKPSSTFYDIIESLSSEPHRIVEPLQDT
jgi:hypothetical protein